MTTTAAQHRDAMLAVFAEITQDAAQLDLRPASVHVTRDYGAGFTVRVQFGGQNVAAVDALANAYELPADDLTWSNYTREGRMEVAGYRTQIGVYCGRPPHVCPPAPAFPAGYAPVPTVVTEIDDEVQA